MKFFYSLLFITMLCFNINAQSLNISEYNQYIQENSNSSQYINDLVFSNIPTVQLYNSEISYLYNNGSELRRVYVIEDSTSSYDMSNISGIDNVKILYVDMTRVDDLFISNTLINQLENLEIIYIFCNAVGNIQSILENKFTAINNDLIILYQYNNED